MRKLKPAAPVKPNQLPEKDAPTTLYRGDGNEDLGAEFMFRAFEMAQKARAAKAKEKEQAK